MIILGIETSCDETGAAILSFASAQDKRENGQIQILSNVVASSAKLQAKYGGIIPEQAAREQLKSIIPVVNEALEQANLKPDELDSIAVTYGPGLIGSLLVGIETAKTLSLVWKKPLIPINHLLGHFYANWISQSTDYSLQSTAEVRSQKSVDLPSFPCIGLLVSGGHTDLGLFEDHGKYKYLGGTRDDAAGECFDKCARLLGLPYPGGPEISKLAEKGDPKFFKLPKPMINSDDFDFSYSGLKTAVANLVHSSEFMVDSKDKKSTNYQLPTTNLAASIEQAIIDPLVKKTIKAAQKFNVKTLILGGGVAANKKLVENLKFDIGYLKLDISLHIPSPNLCTDNASMIASAAFFEKPIKNPLSLQVNPNLSLLS